MATANCFDPLLAAGNSFMTSQPLISGISQKIYDVTKQQNFFAPNLHRTNSNSLKLSIGTMNYSLLNPSVNNNQVVFLIYTFHNLVKLNTMYFI